jgi:hypothetical protein
MEHMFANRPDRSVGSFPAACEKFVRNPQAVETLGTTGGERSYSGGGGFLTITVVAAVRQLSRSFDSLTARPASAQATSE